MGAFEKIFAVAAIVVGCFGGSQSFGQDIGVALVLGDPDARVEVIEVMGLGCTTCKNFHRVDGPFDKFRTGLIDNGQVRWVIRDHPWTNFDFWASRIVRCGPEEGQELRLWHVLDRQLYINKDSDPTALTKRLVEVANELEISSENAAACLNDKAAYEEHLNAHRAFMQSYGLLDNPEFGTPFFIVDGEPVWIPDGKVDYPTVMFRIVDKVSAAD